MNNTLKRDRLIEAAKIMFYQQGVTGTTLADIAQQAQVPLGNVYYHFRTKENFVRAVLERMYEEMFSALVLQVNASAPALTNLRNLLATLARFARKHRSLMVRLSTAGSCGGACWKQSR